MQIGVVHLSALALLLGACLTTAKAPEAADGRAKTSAKPQRLSPAEIAAASMPAIVKIRTPDGFGTGFVVRADGWVVTNLHVIRGADQALVTLSNQDNYRVKAVVSASPEHDLVLLQIDAKGLPALPLGQSEVVRAGDPVVAIGHPMGLEETVSNGLVSAVRKVGDITVLQISAPIASGSSGGPLFNERGEVIGVATAILTGGQNLNLGMPATYVHELMKSPAPVALADFAAAAPTVSEAARLESTQKRDIPRHAPTIWRGCDKAALALVSHGISGAIEVGAPLYNRGNPAACYHVYAGAAADIERRLPKQCKGPRLALERGRAKAAKLNDPSDQAWAMRDAFDGLTDALVRKLEQDREP